MKKVLLTFVLLFVYSVNGFSQSELDGYQYIIVPKQYKFLKDENKYKLNTLTAFLFKKKGFQTFFEGSEFPEDLRQNPCKALNVEMVDNSNLFTSKVYLELENCRKEVVYTSKMGISKEKDYQKSYQEALRDAFTSIENMNYNYDPGLNPVELEKSKVPAVAQAKDKIKDPEAQVFAENFSLAKPATEQPLQAQTDQSGVLPKNAIPESVDLPTVVPVVTSVPLSVTATEESRQPAAAKTADRAHAYKNEELSFLLIPSGDGYQAYISDSKLQEFRKGEVLGNLRKTSLANVFRVSWKNKEGKLEETTGYFDEKGSLVIDVQDKNGEIKTLVFSME